MVLHYVRDGQTERLAASVLSVVESVVGRPAPTPT
jgi:hypothetical protein